MRVIRIASPGGPEALELAERPDPIVHPGEVRVRIQAAGVNRADLLQRMGLYPPPPDAPADVPGLEYAGVVDAVGEGVTRLANGDRVFGLAPGGTYAELLTIHERAVARMPDGLSFVEGAAIPEAFITAYDAMVSQGGLASGERVLIHAVGSGVGSAALQIARAIGATVHGTARTADKLIRAEKLGLRHGVLTRGGLGKEGAFANEVLASAPGGVDVVLDLVGGAYVAEDLRCVALGGRIVVVGMLAGPSVELDLGTLMRRRATVRGTVLRSRPHEERIVAMRAFERHLVPLFAAHGTGALAPVVDRVFSWADAGSAHTYVAKNEGFGKVILEVER